MKLERDISELKEMLEQERAEKGQLLDHNEDNKILIGKLNKELEVAKKKLTEELDEKRERRIKYDAEMSRLRQEIDRRQKESEDIQAQSIEPMDMDILRLKVRKEFETSHTIEMDDKQNIINKLKEERDELKRNLEFLNTKHENLKFDSQRDQDSHKMKYKEELQVVIKENQNLQSQIEMSKERDMLRQARRELEEAKRRIEEYQKECNELRKERDNLKDQSNDLVISHNREIEEERSRKREAIAQNDKLKFKVRSFEDDLQKAVIENDKKAQSIIKLKTEKQALNTLVNEKELAIETIQRQIVQAKDEMRDKENELQSHLRKKGDFELIEKNRLEKLESDLENLQKEYRIQEVERANEREKHADQFNRIEYNYKSVCEENRKIKNKMIELEKEHFTVKQQYDQKCDEFNVIDREYRKYQDHNRQLLIDTEDLKKNYDNSRMQAKLEQEKNQKISKSHEMGSQAWLREKKDLEKRMMQLLKAVETLKSEGTRDQLIEYKKKTNEYKRKVRAANETIIKLGQKLASLGAMEYEDDDYNSQLVQ
jgi:predicted  nucleic acid-binding Zn-ribbon protein